MGTAKDIILKEIDCYYLRLLAIGLKFYIYICNIIILLWTQNYWNHVIILQADYINIPSPPPSPIESLPDKTTSSWTERLLLAKDCFRVVKLKNGDGMLARASDLRDMIPSLLPVSTSQIGLWNCNNFHKHLIT